MTTTAVNSKKDYTEGSIISSILKMGLPSMFGFLAQHLYAMADTFWVSHLPEKEAGVAAITFFTNLMWMLFAFNSLIGPGSVAVISRRYGEKDYENTERAIKETICLKLFFGTILGILGWIFLEDMLRFLGAEGDALILGISYGKILLVGLPLMYATYTIFTALRSIANPSWAMGLMIAANVLNASLDPVFIFGYLGMPRLGIQGAAYASVISFTLVLITGLVLFTTNTFHIKMSLFGRMRISVKSMYKIVKIGIPALLGDLSFSGSRMIITPIVATFGTVVVAAYGVGLQLFGFGIMLVVGIGLGLSSLIGHNLGAQKIERAKSTGNQSILLGISILTLFGVLTYFFAEFYMSLFFDSPETIAVGAEFLRIMAIGFPAFGAFITLEQIHSGVGLNTPYMVVSVIHGWCLQALPALLVVKIFGMPQTAIWWVFTASGFISASIFYIYYRRGRWLTVKV